MICDFHQNDLKLFSQLVCFVVKRLTFCRLHLHCDIHYNQIMKRLFYKVLIPTLLIFALTGCIASPEANPDGAITDPAAVATSDGDDSQSESSAATDGNSSVALDLASQIAKQPLSELLPKDSAFSILFVNVGKADAAILRFGEHTVLIDTGSKESAPQLLAGLNALNVTSIDAVFLTHSHSDHIGGLDALAANFSIPMVYSPFFSEKDKNDTGKIVKRAEKLGLPHKELLEDDMIPITDSISFTVLGPLELDEQDDNDNSLVLQFTYGGKTFLFVGDMQFSEEQTIIDNGTSLKSDLLKVGNHGNPDATGEDFSVLVSPSIGIISTNTTEDTDSANPRVFSSLSMADVFVTQSFPLGILLTLDDAGEINLSNPTDEASPIAVSIEQIDAEQQLISLLNYGSPVDLSGCILFSVRSGAALRFPQGTVLGAGESLAIGEGQSLLFANEDKPLNKKKANTVQLFSPLGTLISELAE